MLLIAKLLNIRTTKKILDKLKRSEKISYYHTKCLEFKSNVKKIVGIN